MKRMKLMFNTVLGVILLLTYAIPSFAATPAVQLVINSQVIQTDAPPVTAKGSNMVSLSSLQQLGLRLQWSAKEKKVTVNSSKNNNQLSLTVGVSTAQFGTESLKLQAPPILKNNRVMVPVRFISEAFGAHVMWNSKDRMVIIRSADQINTYKALYQGEDLVKARKIAVDLPSSDKNTLSGTDEQINYAFDFPEGEALRYYYYEGNLVSYYEIQNDVKHLVWEGVLNENGKYIKEKGKRPVEDKSTVYFRKHRIDNGVDFGRLSDEKPYTGEAANGTLAQIIMKVPNEIRKDQIK